MSWSLSYLALRCVLRLVLLRPRSSAFEELEIVVLRHQLAVLCRQTGPLPADADGSALSCRSESVASAIALAGVCGYAKDAAALAP